MACRAWGPQHSTMAGEGRRGSTASSLLTELSGAPSVTEDEIAGERLWERERESEWGCGSKTFALFTLCKHYWHVLVCFTDYIQVIKNTDTYQSKEVEKSPRKYNKVIHIKFRSKTDDKELCTGAGLNVEQLESVGAELQALCSLLQAEVDLYTRYLSSQVQDEAPQGSLSTAAASGET